MYFTERIGPGKICAESTHNPLGSFKSGIRETLGEGTLKPQGKGTVDLMLLKHGVLDLARSKWLEGSGWTALVGRFRGLSFDDAVPDLGCRSARHFEDFKDMEFHLKVGGGMSGKFEVLKMAKDYKKKLGGGNSNIFGIFTPILVVSRSNLTSIFFERVAKNHQVGNIHLKMKKTLVV